MTLYLCILYIDISTIVFIHTYLYIHIFIYVLNDGRFIVLHNSESIHSWIIQLINLDKAAGLDIVFARLGALILGPFDWSGWDGWDWWDGTLPETSSKSTWKVTETQKERLVFQPSIFRGELLVSGGVNLYVYVYTHIYIYVDVSMMWYLQFASKHLKRWWEHETKNMRASGFLQVEFMKYQDIMFQLLLDSYARGMCWVILTNEWRYDTALFIVYSHAS